MSAKELRRAEVLARVKRKELRLREGAELMGVSYRQAKRLRARYRAGGARGLRHGNVGRRNRAQPAGHWERVLGLVRGHYGGEAGQRFGPTLAAEHLASEHGVEVKVETLRRRMLAAGLWGRTRRRKGYRQRRERRPHFGELVQMDGSFHRWLEQRGPEGCLLDLVDDATGTAAGRFEAEETTWAAADGLRRWVERHGIPRALYTDHKTVYVRPPTSAEELRGEAALTQFGRMCARLGVEIIAAGSPQAKGRIERGHGTHQDRLVKKMRLQGVRDYAAANGYLEKEYWAEHNRRYAVAARQAADYHRPVPKGMDLDEVFSLETGRVVSQDGVVRHRNRLLQLAPGQRVRPRQTVTVQEQRSGKLRVMAGKRELRWSEIAALPERSAPNPVRRPQPPRRANPSPWRRSMHNWAVAAQARRERRERAAVEMAGHAKGGNPTAVSALRTALGNPG